MNLLKYFILTTHEKSKTATGYLETFEGHLPYVSENILHFAKLRKLRTRADVRLYGINADTPELKLAKTRYYELLSGKQDSRLWEIFVCNKPTHHLCFGYRVQNKNTGIAVRSLLDDSFNFKFASNIDEDTVARDMYNWTLKVANNMLPNQRDLLINSELSRQFWAKILYTRFKEYLRGS